MTKRHRRILLLSVLTLGAVGPAMWAARSEASDHQQTALTELNPALDITDVWVFPGSSDDRIVLAMTVGSPIANGRFAGVLGPETAKFDPNALYQLKIDNNKDGTEDLVIQFSFDEMANGTQTADVIGPVAPRSVAQFGSAVRDGFSTSTPVLRRVALNANQTGQLAAAGSAAAGSLQFFAGLRDDPFYVDLEQFFRIIPDRRPTQGPLSLIGGPVPPAPGTLASAWRPACTNGVPNADQANRDQRFGCARDFLAGLNALAIVVELPESQLTRGSSHGELGVWATVSR